MNTVADTAYAFRKWISVEVLAAAGARNQRIDTQPHLALFAWSLPPSTWAGVYRPLSFIEFSPRAGWRVTGFAGPATDQDRIGGEELLARVPGSCRIHSVERSERVPSWSLFPRTNGGFLDALEFAHDAIDRLRDDPPTAVLASGPTFEMFIAASFVARRFGAPLILDYRDEWTECPFEFVRLGKDDRKWERRCLAQAARVLFTTQSQLEHHLAAFRELTPGKALVLPNGWDPSEFDGHADHVRTAPADDAPIRIALVGNLADHAPPDGFLDTFGRLLEHRPEWRDRVVVDFIGRKSKEAKARLDAFAFSANVRSTDHLSKTQAVRAMQQADALLLIAMPELARYLPGKLFDYLAARRPVIVYGAPGEASALVEELDAGFRCDDGNDERLVDILRKLRDLRGPYPGSSRAAQWLERHRRDVLASRLYSILDELQAGSHAGAGQKAPGR